MMPFRRRRDGGIEVNLSEAERELLSHLLEELVGVLGSHSAGTGRDPALARLLPDGYRDDSEAAAEFRRFTEEELVAGKESRARSLARVLAGDAPDGQSALTPAQASSLLRSLTDLRLVFADRLGIEADDDQGRTGPEYEPAQRVYYWLGALQETLVATLER